MKSSSNVHEEKQQGDSAQKSARSRKAPPVVMIIAIVGAIVIVGGGSFAAGYFTGLNRTGNGSMQGGTMDGFGRNGQRGMPGGPGMMSGANGTVTSISDSEITIKTSDGESKTYTITDDTLVTKNRSSVDASDIKKEDSVLIQVAGSNDETAGRIVIDPPQMMEPDDSTQYNEG